MRAGRGLSIYGGGLSSKRRFTLRPRSTMEDRSFAMALQLAEFEAATAPETSPPPPAINQRPLPIQPVVRNSPALAARRPNQGSHVPTTSIDMMLPSQQLVALARAVQSEHENQKQNVPQPPPLHSPISSDSNPQASLHPGLLCFFVYGATRAADPLFFKAPFAFPLFLPRPLLLCATRTPHTQGLIPAPLFFPYVVRCNAARTPFFQGPLFAFPFFPRPLLLCVHVSSPASLSFHTLYCATHNVVPPFFADPPSSLSPFSSTPSFAQCQNKHAYKQQTLQETMFKAYFE